MCDVQPYSEGDGSSVLESLEEKGFAVLDLGGNEMAKIHMRYLGGGKPARARGEEGGATAGAAGAGDGDGREEKLLRFEFPERPGALHRFLKAVAGEVYLSIYLPLFVYLLVLSTWSVKL